MILSLIVFLDPFPSSPFNEQVEDKQVEDELPNPELGSPAPAPPDDHAQDISPRHLTRVRSVPTHLLDYHYFDLFLAVLSLLVLLHSQHRFRRHNSRRSLLPLNLQRLPTIVLEFQTCSRCR